MEIVVDAYNDDERAMGWYYYLDGALNFPFSARCRAKRAISPLLVGDEVDVIGMAPEEECQHEIFVMIHGDRREGLGVPLAQLEALHSTDEGTRQAVEDWLYWVDQQGLAPVETYAVLEQDRRPQ